ncbi:hypothetical protein ASG90_00855 [Nocardioides sp. Soil797]|nr:hypothetical protein ASG90_00855 [Nocardioides sp. Soil797]
MSRTVPTLKTVEEFNAATGVHVDERTVVAALMELHEQGWLSDGPPALTASEGDFLDRFGGVTDDRPALQSMRMASKVRAGQLEREGLTVDQAARRMKISASRVRHRLSEGTLYAYPSQGRGNPRKLPAWQFDGAKPVPRLATVLETLPSDFTQAEIRDFAFHATVDHPTRDVTIPLLEWLTSGGDPAPAVELARAQANVI